MKRRRGLMQAPAPAQLWSALSNAAQSLLNVLQSAEATCEDITGSLSSAAIAAAVGRVTKVNPCTNNARPVCNVSLQ
jgi:hypothetical protein